jgi:hypothetical protein
MSQGTRNELLKSSECSPNSRKDKSLKKNWQCHQQRINSLDIALGEMKVYWLVLMLPSYNKKFPKIARLGKQWP